MLHFLFCATAECEKARLGNRRDAKKKMYLKDALSEHFSKVAQVMRRRDGTEIKPIIRNVLTPLNLPGSRSQS